MKLEQIIPQLTRVVQNPCQLQDIRFIFPAETLPPTPADRQPVSDGIPAYQRSTPSRALRPRMELLGITTIESEAANTEPPNLTRFGRILSYVMPPGTTRRRLYKFLRQSHRKRRKRYGSCEKRGQIQDRRLIDKRPKLVNERKRLGDWESGSFVYCCFAHRNQIQLLLVLFK